MLKQLARAVFTLLLCVLLVGSGLCGALGVVSGFQGGLMRGANASPKIDLSFLGLGALGLAIAALCGFIIYLLWREPPSDS